MAYCDTATTHSTVKNISGGSKKFGFLPPHGMELTADEEVTVFGDIREAVNRGDRFGNRWMNALASALENNELEIRNTPAPVFYDETLDNVRMLVVDNGSVALAEPCWEDSLTV
jgi:hypothetical protein